MKLIVWITLLVISFQDEIQIKPSNEFALKLDFIFRKRPQVDKYTMNFEESKEDFERRNQAGELPFVKLNLKMLKLNDEEVRIRVVNQSGKLVYTKKVDLDSEIEFDLGFTDDLKDHVGDYEFNILLLNQKKKPVSRIHLFVTEDGTFLVNDEKRGKF
ncbi:MAG: hypothetical protein AB7K37_10340 [Cyclobacteriaceae bacterium]